MFGLVVVSILAGAVAMTLFGGSGLVFLAVALATFASVGVVGLYRDWFV
jgi:hypothetical protein